METPLMTADVTTVTVTNQHTLAHLNTISNLIGWEKKKRIIHLFTSQKVKINTKIRIEKLTNKQRLCLVTLSPPCPQTNLCVLGAECEPHVMCRTEWRLRAHCPGEFLEYLCVVVCVCFFPKRQTRRTFHQPPSVIVPICSTTEVLAGYRSTIQRL